MPALGLAPVNVQSVSAFLFCIDHVFRNFEVNAETIYTRAGLSMWFEVDVTISATLCAHWLCDWKLKLTQNSLILFNSSLGVDGTIHSLVRILGNPSTLSVVKAIVKEQGMVLNSVRPSYSARSCL